MAFTKDIEEFCFKAGVKHPKDAVFLYRAIADSEKCGRFNTKIMSDDMEIKNSKGEPMTVKADKLFITTPGKKGELVSLVVSTEKQRKFVLDHVRNKYMDGKDLLVIADKDHVRDYTKSVEKTKNQAGRTAGDIAKEQYHEENKSLGPGKAENYLAHVSSPASGVMQVKFNFDEKQLAGLSSGEAEKKIDNHIKELIAKDDRFKNQADVTWQFSKIDPKPEKQPEQNSGMGLGMNSAM